MLMNSEPWTLSPAPRARPHLCGGPAGHAGPSPAGSQLVSHPQEAGLRAQHRGGHVQAEGHAVVTPCGEKNPSVNARLSLYSVTRSPSWRASLPETATFLHLPLPGMARSHSGTSCRCLGKRDIQSAFGLSRSRLPSSMFLSVTSATL